MFKRLRFAFLLLPILSVGALAGCTAQVGTGAPEESAAQTADLTTTTPVPVAVTAGERTQAAVPQQNLIGQHRTRPQMPAGPVDPDQVENGNPNDPDPSPWVETPGGTDPDPSPWMTQASSSQSTQTK